VFEVHACAGEAGLVGAGQPAGQPGDHESGDFADRYPFGLVDFGGVQADAVLVVAEVAAVEDVEDLVAFGSLLR